MQLLPFSELFLWVSQYGKDYDYDAPVKLLDKLLHSMAQTEDEQLVVVSQVRTIIDFRVSERSFSVLSAAEHELFQNF